MSSETSATAVVTDIDTDPVDSEGLHAHYDVVICGTGLVQSILASAIARYSSGKKILHVDGSDHYGNLDAVWTLPYLLSQGMDGDPSSSPESVFPPSKQTPHERQEIDVVSESDVAQIPLNPKGELSSLRFHSMERTSAHCLIRIRKPVETPYGTGRIRALRHIAEDMVTLVIELTNWPLANGTLPVLYVGIPRTAVTEDRDGWSIDGTYMWNQYRIRTVTAHRAAQILDQYSRSLALDATPYLLYASGPAVDGLLLSTVSNYLEFKSLEAVLYYTSSPRSLLSNGKGTPAGTFTRVPCSKNDVFASQLLSPMDKRRLMKFLHLALDYATATANTMGSENHDDVHALPDVTTASVTDDLLSLNERHLNQGRSLMRPQNKAVASTELQHLQELCRASSAPTSFVSYLRDDQKLSPPLVALIRYALALDTNCDGAADDEANDNGTSVSMGMEQLCAHMLALGRFGTTAFLVPLYGSGELSQAFCRSAAVYGATYLLRRAPTAILCSEQKVSGIHLSQLIDDESTPALTYASSKKISCTHVVVPYSCIQHRDSTSPRVAQHVLRRISILTGKPIQIESDGNQQQQQRHVLIIPPYSISKQQKSAIHGLLVDEFVNVAPHVPGGCTILHLTTTIDSTESTSLNDSFLSEAFNIILESFRSTVDGEVAEIFHVSFSYKVSMPHENETKNIIDGLPKSNGGLHLIYRPRPGLTADCAFQQAAAIFQQIYPNSTPDDFLSLSQATTDAIKASLGENALNNDDDDEEIMALTSAVEMIGKPQSDAPSTSTSKEKGIPSL